MSADELSWITPGVGSAISGTMTAIGAIFAVWIAQRYFGSKVRDLKSALSETETAIESFRSSVLIKFAEFDEALATLNATTGALQESASKTQAAVYEAQEAVEEVAAEGDVQIHSPRDIVKGYWSEISNHLEEIASSEAVDGRTRAKYGRIDRRSYYDLITALDADGRLAGAYASAWRAAEIWYSCRRANAIGADAMAEIERLREVILSIPKP